MGAPAKKGRKAPIPEPVAKVIFDSSFLFIPAKFHMDIYEELARLLNRSFEPIILTPTRDELVRLAEEGSTQLRKHAALALQVARKCRMVSAARGDQELHDDMIVRVAMETGSYVATNDRALRRKLRHVGVPVIYLRQRSRLAVDGALG